MTAAHPESIERSLRAIWDSQLGLVRDRVKVIEDAVLALTAGRLDEPGRLEAERTAHMLAGAVGTFGFPAASAAAKELERAFGHTTSAVPGSLAGCLHALRADLDRPALDGGA